MNWSERAAAAAQANIDARWGMWFEPDTRQEPPAILAKAAFERGDQFFQIDLPISTTLGMVADARAATKTLRAEWQADYLGEIEAQGWSLFQFTTSYIQQGGKIGRYTQGVMDWNSSAVDGTLVGIYLFRRRAL